MSAASTPGPDVLEMLKEHDLFAGLAEDDLRRLVDMARPLHLEPGQVLMQEGTPGASLYLVLDGEFEVTKRSGQQDVHLAVRGAGEVFGEMSILDQSPRSATLVATPTFLAPRAEPGGVPGTAGHQPAGHSGHP